MHEAVAHIHRNADLLREESRKCDELGMLTPETARVLRESGGIRLLQALDHGGYQERPAVFHEWARAVAQYSPSAGWVAGVVGVHPWEVALFDPQLQQEIYGENPDTWTASPYAPFGRAKKVEGGFLFTGDWPYSTGTDYCDWVILGGIVTDEGGNIGTPPDIRHFVLPRGDYEIVEDSWNVMGLTGTGSKNVRMKDQFIPDSRVAEAGIMVEMGYAQERRPGVPLYALPQGVLFSCAIASATLGIARGALDVYREYMQKRVSVAGVVAKVDPFQQAALAEAEADWNAAVLVVDKAAEDLLLAAERGEPITRGMRLEARRDQVRAIQRVLESVDKVYSLAGSAAVWTDKPLERYWRDLRVGASHMCNIYDTIYTSWVNYEFNTGGPVNALH